MKAPHSPRSAVQTTSRCTWSLPVPASSFGAVSDAGDRRGDIAQHLVHALGIGPRRLRRGLRAAQLRGRDHLHGLGDLLRRLGGGDAVAQVLEAGMSDDGGRTTEDRWSAG